MKKQQRFKLGAGAGLVTMLLGALMVLAPTAGAVDGEDLHLNDPTLWSVTAGTPTYDAGTDMTTYIYTLVRTPLAEEDDDNQLSNVVVADFCIEPDSVEPSFDEAENSKWETPGELEAGDQFVVRFAGDQTTVDETGSTWFLTKGGITKEVSAPGPACGPPPDRPDITIVKAAVPQTVLPADRTFTFDDPFEGQFGLKVGESHEDEDLDADTYRYTEVADVDYPLAYIECGEVEIPGTEPEDELVALAAASFAGVYDEEGALRGVDITLVDEDATCTFFNEGDTPPEEPPPVTNVAFSVDLEKLNDADEDGDFDDFENALAEGDDVDFEITIVNTGTGALTLSSLTDTFDGDVVDLLADVVLSCERAGDNVVLAVGAVLPVGSTTVCTFTLEDYAPAAGTTLENTVEIDTTQTLPASDTSTVGVPEVLEEATGTITLVKEVTGDEATEWSFDFTGAAGAVTLTHDAASSGLVPVDAGEYSIAEDISDLPDGWEFEDATCVDQTGAVVGDGDDDGSVDFTVAPNAAVTCTFVNEYTAPTVTVAPETEVKGDVVTRPQTLPRTGDETRNLAGVGGLMLVLGAALVLGSKRQLARC